MDENFLLGHSELARRLYDEVAAEQPVIDYHNHLSAADLAADRSFETLADVWVANDPYKHRAMRIAGVPETRITGDATPWEKFEAWAATAPKTLGSPLAHWTMLELSRVFGIREALTPQSAERIWETANACLRRPACSARGLLRRFNVACACTSDALLDDLAPHRALADCGCSAQVLPSLRGDDVVSAEPAWLARLGARICDFDDFRAAVCVRLDAFGAAGCRLADHALDAFTYVDVTESEAAALFRRQAAGEPLSPDEALRLRSAALRFLGVEYGRRGWIMQLHLGAQRWTSTRLRRLAGAAGGYAAPGRACDVASLCAFLDALECEGALPRTILYTLNPADDPVLATLTGSYAEDGVAGKIQFGPAWWYNDHALGIRRHLETLANYGLLATFIGMTTDSRSLLSLVRHETFRRLLCGTLGAWAAQGLVPDDFEALAPLVRDVTYGNAKRMVMEPFD